MNRGIETHGGTPILPISTTIEGEFKEWKLHKICETGILADLGDYVSIGDDGTIYVFDDDANSSLVFSKDGVLLDTLVNRMSYPVSWTASVTGKYSISMDLAGYFIAVHKGSVELWRKNPNEDRGDYVLTDPPLIGWWFTAMSPRSEWLIIPVVEAASLKMLIFIYKGVT